MSELFGNPEQVIAVFQKFNSRFTPTVRYFSCVDYFDNAFLFGFCTSTTYAVTVSASTQNTLRQLLQEKMPEEARRGREQ